METFLMGAIAMGWVVAAVFFLRFWRETRDRLFLIFSIAFCLLAATRIIMASIGDAQEEHSNVYWIRLCAYALILVAIVDKNRPRSATTS